MSLDSIIGSAESVRSALAQSPYRRLSDTPEVQVFTPVLCQSLHVNRLDGDPILLLGDEAEGYWMHSVASLGAVLDRLSTLGIHRIYVGLGVGQPALAPERNLDAFVEIMAGVRRAAGPGFQILVDPAGLCMRPDLRWGVTDPTGEVDVEATAELFARAAVELAQAGMDALMTIGRLNCEVEIARRALAKVARPIQIMSFSTNSETTSAYFDKTRDDISRASTGQKILVGNGHEMAVRALGDFGEGADVIVQKPIEAAYNLVLLRLLATGQLCPTTYVETTPQIGRLLEASPWMRPAIERASAALRTGERSLRTGAYEVSGTYCITHHLMRHYSDQLAWAMLDELYRNTMTAAGSTIEILISRSVAWYVQQKIRFQTKG